MADDNAVIAAEDAFGTQIDQQSIGLYSQTDARGFNPQEAGNLRIEGLYFDQETLLTNPCLVRETNMRVGIAAQSFSFPSPTGIADLKLRVAGDTPLLSALLTRGPLESETATLEAQLPLAGHALGVDLCAAYYDDFDLDAARNSHGAIYAATAAWRPSDNIEVIPFGAFIAGSEREQLPAVYTVGTYPLPSFVQRDLLTQQGTSYGWHQLAAGAVVRSDSENWKFAAGVFLSQERDPSNVNPYFLVQNNAAVDYSLDVVPRAQSEGTSGELRLARKFSHGNHTQVVELAARGRSVDRQFGGDQVVDFGTIGLLEQACFTAPPPEFSAVSHDLVHQADVGLMVEEQWQSIGSLAFGALTDHYHRTVQTEGMADASASASPWLKNVRFTLNAAPTMLLYGSYVQGVEDSPLAPPNATNRGELPPASLTWQVDGGVRLTPAKSLQIVLGAFEIHKPYLNLDDQGIYRTVGQLTHRGIESSVSVTNGGLTVLAGAVYLHPRAERSDMAGAEEVPLGPVPVTLTGNIDLAPTAWKGFGASLQLNWLSSRTATVDGSSYLAPLTTVGAGIRYVAKWGARQWSLRLDGSNLTNAQGLNVSSVGQVVPEWRRRAVLTFAVDL